MFGNNDHWPLQKDAAELLGVEPSSVLRWLDEMPKADRDGRVVFSSKGKHLAPDLVLQIAEQQLKDVYDVADTLLANADELENTERNQIRDRVNRFLAGYEKRGDPNRRLTRRELMEDIRVSLPPSVYAKLEERLAAHRTN